MSAQLGFGAASYVGGRAEVRVRRHEVRVIVADVTSMYPTVFILQGLQSLLASKKLYYRDVTEETIELLNTLRFDALHNRETWKVLNRLVLLEPSGDLLPVRMRPEDSSEPWTIAIAHYRSETACWYSLADVLAAKIQTGKIPKILRAIEIVPGRRKSLRSVNFRNSVPLNPGEEIFKTIVERRQETKRAKKQSPNSELGRLDLGLKQFAASGAYGIMAEVNVTPSAPGESKRGHVYSDITFPCDVRDERPGKFANFILASLVTGGSRLLLSMLEVHVREAGGTFAFCDTDSLAIVLKSESAEGLSCLEGSQAKEILKRFNRLNPYAGVSEFIKIEHGHVYCFAISAKRYVLYTRTAAGRIKIVKCSESGLGAIIGRSERETTKKLARRIWLHILSREVAMNGGQRRRVQQLCNFEIPLRRKLPLTQPDILRRFTRYNRNRDYSERVKPFGFLQAMTIASQGSHEDVRPIAPFERTVTESRKLPWMDAKTGKAVAIDWEGNGWAQAIPVIRLDEYVERYRIHPESKAADAQGTVCTEETRGLLYPLHLESDASIHVGKEVDRLDEDEGTTLTDNEPIVYRDKKEAGTHAAADLEAAIEYLATLSQGHVSKGLGISERRWRDIAKGRAQPHRKRVRAIIRLALEYRGRAS